MKIMGQTVATLFYIFCVYKLGDTTPSSRCKHLMETPIVLIN